MVRLKDHHLQMIGLIIRMFQFPNGSIKSVDNSAHKRGNALFQFPNGSIKSAANIWVAIPTNLFQFPNGSIKSHDTLPRMALQKKFQFPNGSIKRSEASAHSTGLACFNSLMVRLKVSPFICKAFINVVSIP